MSDFMMADISGDADPKQMLEAMKKYAYKTELKPCPFCGRNMKYQETRWAFVWEVRIVHDYDTRKLYTPCSMSFAKAIPRKDRTSGEVFGGDWVKRRKEQFIESWNRRVNE